MPKVGEFRIEVKGDAINILRDPVVLSQLFEQITTTFDKYKPYFGWRYCYLANPRVEDNNLVIELWEHIHVGLVIFTPTVVLALIIAVVVMFLGWIGKVIAAYWKDTKFKQADLQQTLIDFQKKVISDPTIPDRVKEDILKDTDDWIKAINKGFESPFENIFKLILILGLGYLGLQAIEVFRK